MARARPPIWRPKTPDQRRLIVTYPEPARAWGITLNQHAAFFPVPLLGQRVTESSGAIELTYDAAGIVTAHHRRSNDILKDYEPMREEEYEPILGKDARSKIFGAAE